MNTRQPFWIVGAAPIPGVPANTPEPTPPEPFTATDVRKAVSSITLTLILGGIVGAFVAGVGFALGSGLVSRHVLKERR